MSRTKLVSVIVPVFNAGEKIHQSIDSLLNQTYDNLEIIIVDDGSTDNSLELCLEYSNKFLNIKVIHQNNKGVSSARNVGLTHVLGEYVYFMDADDYASPDLISDMIEQAEANNLDIVICSYSVVQSNTTTDKIASTNELELLDYKESISRLCFDDRWAGYLWNKIFKTKIIDKHKFNTEIYMKEDLLFCYSLINENTRIGFYNKCLYNYYKWGNNSTNQGLTDKRLTLLYANEMELKYLESVRIDKNLVECIGKRLLKLYYDTFYKLMFNAGVKNKFFWMKYISSKIREYSKVYSVFSEMSFRWKVEYVIVSGILVLCPKRMIS